MKRMFRIVSIVLVMTLFMMAPANVSAANMTQDQAIVWVQNKVGTLVGAGQCVSLVAAYIRALGGSAPSVNYARQYSTCTVPAGFTRIAKANGSPQKGDILIWTGGSSGMGHVAIYESNYSTYHQNVSGHQYVEKLTYYYTLENWDTSLSYWGVMRPNFGSVPTDEINSCTSCSTSYAGTYRVKGTSGSLAINNGHGSSSVGYTQLGSIPEGATVTITKASGYNGQGKSSGHWGHVTYNGIKGLCAMNYLEKVDSGGSSSSCSMCSTAYAGTYKVSGTSGSLAINSGHGSSAQGYTQLGSIPEGAVITITMATGYNGKGNSAGNWGHVTYNGVSGCCAMNFLVKQSTSCTCSEAHAGYYQVDGTAGALAISSGHGPSYDYTELGAIPEGTIIYISKATGYNGRGNSSGNWGHVTYNGISGYCAMNFLIKQTSYKISFNGNGGSVSTSNVTVCKGSTDNNNVSDLRPARSDYTFLGWYTASSGGTQVYNASGRYVAGTYWTSSGAYAYSGNLTLYAHWQQNVIFPTGITLSQTTLNLNVWDTASLTATVSPSNATNKSVYWSSSNTNIVTVSSTGSMTALAAGTATVTCRSVSNDSVYATCRITVSTVPVTGISLSSTAITMTIGETAELTSSVLPSNATDFGIVTWVEGDGIVEYDGLTIQALDSGDATIHVESAENSGISATCVVTVNPTITDVDLNRYTVAMASEGIGSSYQLKGKIIPEDGRGALNWSSNHPEIVLVDSSGRLTAQQAGRATVTFSAVNGPSVSCLVTVKEDMSLMNLPADLIEIQEDAFKNTGAERISLPSGVEAIGKDAFSDNSQLNYVRIPNSVGSIGEGAFAGDRNLCIICGENSTAKTFAEANAIDYVIDNSASFTYVRSITMESSLDLVIDDAFDLHPTVLPATASNPALEWNSSNASVVSVSETGIVRALEPGKAVITASALDGSGKTASCIVTVSFPDVDLTAVMNTSESVIGDNKAVLSADLSVGGTLPERIEAAGIQFYTESGSSISRKAVETSEAVFTVTFDTAEDLGIELEPETTYRYQYFVVVSGVTFKSSDLYITTVAGIPRIVFESDTITVSAGSTVPVNVRALYSDSEIIWHSSNSSVAYVLDGELVAVKAGTAQITAILADDTNVRASCTVTVIN